MSEKNSYSDLAAPKGLGFSRRLIALFVGIFAVVVVLFLVFLHHYAPSTTTAGADVTQPRQFEQNTTAIEEIDGIRKTKHNPALLKRKPASSNKSQPLISTHQDPTNTNALASLVGGLTKKEFKRASESRLSVFQPTTPIHARDDKGGLGLNLNNRRAGPQSSGNVASVATPYSLQNMQAEKKAFLRASKQTEHYDTMHAHLKPSFSPFEIKAGTIIPAVLMTGINSNLPGNIIAKVRRNVYDTTTGNTLLIPQGTTILGVYDSQVAYGQSRVLMAWNRLIFPNGTSFDLDAMPGVDLAGMAGLHDLVNNHYLRIFGSALLFSVFGAAGQLSQPAGGGNGPTARDIIFGAIGQQVTQVGAKLAEKNMDIQPTLSIRPGASFNVLLSRDMVFPGAYKR